MKHHNRHLRSALLSSLFLASASVAGAAVMQYAGTFSASFPVNPPEGQTYQGIPALSGTWSFEFDDSMLVSGQFVQSFVVDIDTLSLTPGTINLTEFTTLNSEAELVFINGNLSQLMLGGKIMGASGSSGGTDDWGIAYDGESHDIQVVTITSAASSGFQYVTNGSGSFNPSVVPEPGSSLLAVTAVAGLLFRRSRRA